MHRAPPRIGVFGRRFDLVDGRLRGLELVALVDDGTRFFESAAELLGPRIGRFDLDPTRRPAPDRPPKGSERNGDSPQESEPALHEADATLPPASCPAAAQRGRPDRRKESLGS
jgi:hypothetical protein